MDTKPTDWHKRPRDTQGPCPICGLPAEHSGEHRRVVDPAAKFPRFVKRRKSGDGWKLRTIDLTPLPIPEPPPSPPRTKGPKRRPVKRPRLPSGPKEQTRQRILAAVKMRVLQGKSNLEIAEALGIDSGTLAWYRATYSVFWQSAEEALGDQVVAIVRAQAGTDDVLKDVDLYLHRATVAEKWTASRGESLFPEYDQPTLTSFYRTFYLPVCLPDAAESTKKQYDVVLKRWRLITGDPPLAKITTELLAKFRDVLSRSRGLRTCKRASPHTVATKLRQVQTLLDKAGPPERRNRDAAGIIPKVPWIRPPRTEPRPVRVVEPGVLDACYLAAVGMELPRIDAMKPAKWWRALIVLSFNTGLRRSTIFRLRWEWLLWTERVFRIPGDSMKSRRLHVAPLNQTVLDHLRGIHSDDRELVLPWPNNMRHFDRHWHRLLDLAGIRREDHFGLHTLRKTLATTLWESSPQAAQLALSHADSAVTQLHYVQGTRIVAAAIDALAQPSSFTGVHT